MLIIDWTAQSFSLKFSEKYVVGPVKGAKMVVSTGINVVGGPFGTQSIRTNFVKITIKIKEESCNMSNGLER